MKLAVLFICFGTILAVHLQTSTPLWEELTTIGEEETSILDETTPVETNAPSSSVEPTESTESTESTSVTIEDCGRYAFTCANGQCISRLGRCNGENDCGDDSDEKNCSENQCEADEFKCGSGKCIASRWICDHENDCPDGEDEFNCTVETTTESIETTPEWIETTELELSDESTSHDDSSEHSLTSTTENIVDSKPPHECGENQFECNTGICLPRHWVCDHVVDCSDGEDELKCLENRCTDNEFKCNTGACIPRTWMCNNWADCAYGDDEWNCMSETTTDGIETTESNSSDDSESEPESEIDETNEEIDSDDESSFESNSNELAHVVYNTPSPLRVRLSNKYVVEQNTDFALPCKAVGKKSVQATWHKMYDETLGPNVRQIGNVLKISNAQPMNHGIYQCTVEANCQNATATTFIVVEPQKVPVIEIYPSESQVVDVGQRVALDCRVLAGSPKPNLQWIRRDLKAFSYRISVQQLSWRSASLLIIRDITEEEAGQYECVASNVAGKVSKVISIIVREPKPTISIWPNVKQMNVTEGTQLALYCGVDASTQMDIKWYGPNTANSRNEFLPNGIVLHKHNVSRSDGGIYICRVSNKSGTQRKQIKVLVQPKLSMNEKP